MMACALAPLDSGFGLALRGAAIELPAPLTPTIVGVIAGIVGAVLGFVIIAFLAKRAAAKGSTIVRIPPYRTGYAATALPAEPGLSYRVFPPPRAGASGAVARIIVPAEDGVVIPPPPAVPSDLAVEVAVEEDSVVSGVLLTPPAEVDPQAALPRRPSDRPHPLGVISGSALKLQPATLLGGAIAPQSASPSASASASPSPTSSSTASGVRVAAPIDDLSFEDCAKTELTEPLFDEAPRPLSQGPRPRIRRIEQGARRTG
jgi:hypothetical protein